MSNNNSDQVSDDVEGLDQAVQIETTQVMTAQGLFQDLAEEVSDVEVNDNSSKQVSKESMEKILDVPVQLTAELGRTKITIKNLLQLVQGSVIELDAVAGAPMDVLINGYLIAQGEVVVVDEKFGIRLTDIITPSERIHKINR